LKPGAIAGIVIGSLAGTGAIVGGAIAGSYPKPTPEPTPAPTPAPASPCTTYNPCATVERKYAAVLKDVPKTDSTATWAFPLAGGVAMVSCASLALGLNGLRKRAARATRQVNLVQPVLTEDPGLQSETDGLIE
jgi:hypothetical protein